MEKKKILIVDDQIAFPKMAKLYLERTGNYTVECESDSLAAVQTARSVQPDLILLDLIMPGQDGAELKHQMENDPFLSSIPKIFVTSTVSKGDTEAGGLVQTGDGLMLPKTSTPKVVIEVIEQKLAENLD